MNQRIDDTTYNGLFGRKDIYVTDDITPDNIIQRVNEVLQLHAVNVVEENELYWRRRGISPIFSRIKEVRPDINYKIAESSGIINYIVTFDNGWFLTQPAYYVARKSRSQSKVNKLNEFLYLSGKTDADNKVSNWFHTVGKGVIWVKGNTPRKEPPKVYVLDPRSACVAYSLGVEKEPLLGIHVVMNGNQLMVDAITRDSFYTLTGEIVPTRATVAPTFTGTVNNILSITPNLLGMIPIIEYSWDENNIASIEPAISMLDAVDTLQSDRLNGVAQFIQSLLVTWNCKFDDDMDANKIRQYGLINLIADGENRQDVKILSDQLDQAQTQVFVDDLYEKILSACCVPATTKGGTSTSDTGVAVLARDGYVQADAKARNSEDVFKNSNKHFDKLFTEILRRKKLLDINASEYELLFVRNETSNIQSKAQACHTLINAGLHPELAFARSGVSNDPVADYKASEAWLKLRWGDPDAPNEMGSAPGGEAAPEGSQTPESANKSSDGTNISQQRKGWVSGYYRG